MPAIYTHLRVAVNGAEYEATGMGKSKKAEIFGEFERRVGTDPGKRGKGLQRVDFLGGRFRAQGTSPRPVQGYRMGGRYYQVTQYRHCRRQPVAATTIIIWRTEKEVYYWYLLTPPGAILPGQVLYNISHQSTPPSPIIIPIASISSRHVSLSARTSSEPDFHFLAPDHGRHTHLDTFVFLFYS